jgi:uncharacterized protein YkwD
MRVGEPGVILSGMEARERPGYGPRRGRHEWLVAVLAMVLLFTFGLAGSGDAATAYDAEELEFVRLINDYREQNGLRPLILSDTLAVAAERHSEDMAEYSFFAHNTEGSSHYAVDSEPWDRMRAEGYDYNTYKGENLAVGYETAEEAMRAWKESPSHNAAMLDGDYRVIGVARINAPGSVHGWYWTTDFGGRVDPSAHTPGESPQVRQPQQRTVVAPQDQPEETRKPPTTPYGSPAGPSGDTGALDNGRMGKVGGWSQKARDGADLVVEEGYARLGGYNDGEDELRQRVRIGGDAALVYDVRVKAGGEDPDDTMVVRLTDGDGEQVAVLGRHSGRNASGWSQEQADLSRFAGRTLFLSIGATTDGERMTTFYLDGLTLRP